ncbi:MAG: saccharopine dehydrogenase NADP-binding domain-containing protein [Halodesulfovibrio sp.]|uniref:saccharopine dehydrogenase NADP-binding domain-containing protein n=1 Tax=Halodesulfovibrio sp. TaxID=1912772 RepID=UPI00359D3A65
MKKVAILGGYGKVGSVAASYLMQQGDADLYICGRNFQAASNTVAKLTTVSRNNTEKAPASCKPYQVDIKDPKALRSLLSTCDVVVNCTGPTALIGDTVARAAVESDCHMVDPGGYDYVIELIRDLEDEVAKRKLQLCFAAGIVPGISASLPLSMAKKFSQIFSIKSYFAGEDVWSYGSMYDMVCGMGELKELGASQAENRKRTPLPFSERFVHFPVLPEPFGKSIAQPFYTKEFERVVKQTKAFSGKCFWVNTGPLFSATLSLVSLTGCYRHPYFTDLSARLLCRVSALDNKRKNTKGYMLVSTITGVHDGKVSTTEGILRFPDSYTGTGLASAMMAHRIVTGKSKHLGIKSFPEMMEPKIVLATLQEQGITIEYISKEGE